MVCLQWDKNIINFTNYIALLDIHFDNSYIFGDAHYQNIWKPNSIYKCSRVNKNKKDQKFKKKNETEVDVSNNRSSYFNNKQTLYHKEGNNRHALTGQNV